MTMLCEAPLEKSMMMESLMYSIQIGCNPGQ